MRNLNRIGKEALKIIFNLFQSFLEPNLTDNLTAFAIILSFLKKESFLN